MSHDMVHADYVKLMNILTLNKMTNSKAMDVKSLTNRPFSGNWTRYNRLCSFGFVTCAGIYGYYNSALHIK